MRILLVDTAREMRGGQRQVALLASGMLRAGADVRVAVRPDSPLGARLAELDVPTVFVQPRFEGDPLAARSLGRVIDLYSIDLVNAQSSHDHTLAWFAGSFATRTHRRVVTRRVDFGPGSGWFNRRKYLRGADRYIAISDAIARVLTEYGVPAWRIETIHSSVTPIEPVPGARNEVLAELGWPDDSWVVGDVAALEDHKGHVDLIDAFALVAAKHASARLALIGDGSRRAELEARVRQLGLGGRVRLLGHRTDVARLLSALDLFAMTSRQEGLCTSILDAMSAGVPVVATNAGGIPEIVRDGETGRLARTGDPASIAEKILDAAATSEFSRKLAERARHMVRDEFGVDGMVKKSLGVYTDLMKC
ncbi:MAG: glycosyltransferase [Deltaproteobacteria bacterium]|nr:glycosyltransferase [Deltaproteobacteria bacterium]